MSTRRLPRHAATLLVLGFGLVLAAAPAQGTGRDAAIGSEGELYVVREGAYGELFPESGLADPSHAVLALDVVRSDQSIDRLLVPGTETLDVEDSASLLFEDRSATVFLLWQTRVNLIHSRLSLIGYQGGRWTDPIEISGNPFGWKSAPQFTTTKDAYEVLDGDGVLRTITRTVAHLIWAEEGYETPLILYTPVVWLDGRYAGWNPVYSLSELALGSSGGAPVASNSALAAAPRIETGKNAESAVVGFVHGDSGELVSITVELLPGEITFIADRVRNQISDLGRQYLPGQPTVLADKVRNQISDLGNRLGLHPGVTSYLAEKSHAEVLAGAAQGPSALAERVRNQISDLGSRITDRGFGRLSEKSSLKVLELPNSLADGVTAPTNLLRVLRASARTVPATGTEKVVVHLSQNGREAVVAWSVEGAVLYRESQGAGWSAPRRLRLADDLDLARAHEILARRADERSDR